MSSSFENHAMSPASTQTFIPKELPVNKDVLGISRTVFTHASKLRALLEDWVTIQGKGTKLCKSIAALKLHECTEDYYPGALSPLTDSLVQVLDSLKHIMEEVEVISSQFIALSKLESTTQPVISTWPVMQISDAVNEISCALQKEYKLKEVVSENIAHTRDEDLIEVYVSSWEFDPYLDLQASTSYLFAEVGLPGITGKMN